MQLFCHIHIKCIVSALLLFLNFEINIVANNRIKIIDKISISIFLQSIDVYYV